MCEMCQFYTAMSLEAKEKVRFERVPLTLKPVPWRQQEQDGVMIAEAETGEVVNVARGRQLVGIQY